MAWRETCVMDERLRFVVACLAGDESFSELCRQHGISRKTGYKWLGRYRQEGGAGLADRSRAPHGNPRSVGRAVVEMVLAVRHRHPSWGPRKVKAYLEDRCGDRSWPSASTMGNLFDRAGLTRSRKRRRRAPPQSLPFSACGGPNDVWCVDFKGWFLTGDGIQVDPLTLSDASSRYLLCLEALGRPDEAHVWPVFCELFREFGLPLAMRSDNGSPFASRGAGGLSQLAVKLIKVGVLPERIAPGKPQQNGRHERMHLTLKQETASLPADSLAEQILRFRDFRQSYNHERPHEALGQVPPARLYRPSPRSWDGRLRSPEYPAQAEVRRVRSNGEIKWRSKAVFINKALSGEPVGLHQVDEALWQVKYGPVLLGTLRGRGQWQRA